MEGLPQVLRQAFVGLFCLFVTAAMAGASGAASGAFGSVRTTDALDTLFSGFADIQNRKAQDHDNYSDNQIINRIHRQLLSVDSVVFLYVLVGVGAQDNQNGGEGHKEA